jgi:cyclic beta-1,2-glucan synthetase
LARELSRLSTGTPKSLSVIAHHTQFRAKLRVIRRQMLDRQLPDADPAAMEWFLDNFYLLTETSQLLSEDMPMHFYRTLPSVVWGGQVVPRVYALAQHMLRGPQVLERSQIEAFLADFQTTTPLRIGELWGLPAMLRVVSLEGLAAALESEQAQSPPSTSDNPRSRTVSKAVRTLIVLKAISWRAIFERTSLVHRELCKDPAGIYRRMEAKSCDRYLAAIEALSRRVGDAEIEVAKSVVAMAHQTEDAASPRQRHVGFYLVDQGRPRLEAALGYRLALGESIGRLVRRVAAPFYLVLVGLSTLVALVPLLVLLARVDVQPFWAVAAILLALVPASSFGIAWVQWMMTQSIAPQPLPRLEFEEGIPLDCKTAVVIPTLLGDLSEVHDLVKQMEQHYLANPDPNLQFALLADYVDAPLAQMAPDSPLVERTREGVELLNHRYGHDGVGPFHLLVRERRWNARDRVWMGWERKRGKLEEFNRLLTGDPDTSYKVHHGQRENLEGIRFVITLDSDTELPRDAARRLVSILAHPLNQAEFVDGRVSCGYTVLQPRLDINPDASHRSRFSQIFAGDTGLDIYSRAVSDVYQDLFGAGVYVGKGIYDLEAFRRSMEGRFPENALLSHDLFEGLHGRVGLVTDVVLYEDYPSTYLAFARRLHRWIRGDWQLLPWLASRVPGARGATVGSPFAQIDRWKLLDNMRRSLHPVTLFGLLAAAWTLLPGSPLGWTVVALVFSAGPLFTSLASHVRALLGGSSLGKLGRSLVDSPNDALRWLIALISLPHEAVVVVDAIGRTLARVFFTRRRLLEWTTAAHTAKGMAGKSQRTLMWWEMMGGPALALGLAPAILVLKPTALPVALPWLVAWFASPELALWLSRPRARQSELLSAKDEQTFRLLARRIWLFFETFVGPDDQWLPPDNIQQNPNLQIAHRTSPTNIGLYFSSAATAYDLGYLQLDELCLRLRNSFRTLESLERHRGQLLNWYDTSNLEALAPKYVSTVDNGNFAASLIALRQACAEYAAQPIFRKEVWAGLRDLTSLIERSIGELLPHQEGTRRAAIDAVLSHMFDTVDRIGTPETWSVALDRFSLLKDDLLRLVKAQLMDQETVQRSDLSYEVFDALDLLDHHVLSLRSTFDTLAGWFFDLANPPPELLLGEGTALSAHTALLTSCRAIHLDELELDALLMGLDDALAQTTGKTPAVAEWREKIAAKLARSVERADQLLTEILDAGASCDREISRLDFALLYDSECHQLFIGYDVSAAQPDPHHYDLLASEARLASLIAIALGQVPVKHWFHLRRPVARLHRGATLLSWSGTMFEFLMPPLFTRSFEKTLLGRSADVVVEHQIRYAQRLKVPWGISESAFALCDKQGQYQYRAFGVPGLGLKRGLADDLVIAPYASILAVNDHPGAVAENLDRLRNLGAWGQYGAVEAIDFTVGRALEDGAGIVVHAYMAHHQGMSLVSLGNLLAAGMPARFHGDRRIQTVAHLLQERSSTEATKFELPEEEQPSDIRLSDRPWTSWSPRAASPTDPQAHILSNGQLSVACDRFLRGGLWLNDVQLRPWEDGQDAGAFCLFLHLSEHQEQWALAGAPLRTDASEHAVSYWPHMVEKLSRLAGMSIRQQVFLAGDSKVEIRRVTLVNESSVDQQMTLTAYADVSLNRPDEHHRHPAFSRMFLHTSVRDQGRLLICTRRPRGPDEKWPVLVQACIGAKVQELSWETSRREFVGRGRSLPSANHHLGEPLRGTVGNVLDPCLVQRVTWRLPAGQRRTVAWLTAVGADEAQAIATLGSHTNLDGLSATLEHSEVYTRSRLSRLGLDVQELMMAQRLLARMQHSHQVHGNKLDRRRLWGHGISGDRRLLLFHCRNEGANLLSFVLKVHALWRDQHLNVEVAILLHDAPSYVDDAREKVRNVAKALGLVERQNELAVVSVARLGPDDLEALQAAASFVIDDQKGSIEDQLDHLQVGPRCLAPFTPARSEEINPPTRPLPRPTGLSFDNELGGFSADGKQYIIYLPPGANTPAPWCNVLANPQFGCLVSERGLGSTWAVNAGENRLTPWSNDPVCDPPSEAIYLRDEETGTFWSATPAPRAAATPYLIEHGLGITRFGHQSHGMEQWVRVVVDPEKPVKLIEFELRNVWHRPRRLTITYYAEWILGTRASQCSRFIRQTVEADTRALFAQNSWLLDDPEQTAFLASSENIHGFTTDREEFLGLGGLAEPDALRRWGLSNSERPVALPCGVLQIHVDLPPEGSKTLHFALGWGADAQAARALAAQSTELGIVQTTTEAVAQRWHDILSAVQIETPQTAMDVMVNTWTLYQTVSSRLFARTGFYQSSGAIGFRDQLQDVMALCYGAPLLAREQILNAAAHQFEAGDVLHWWHPPSDRGVRTRCSDDLVWLPYVVSHYVRCTGDVGILREQVAFLSGPELDAKENDQYGAFEKSTRSDSLLEHCRLALERAFTVGEHGLPLIGSGDWNDGMNLVGREGRGESVWLGWFLIATLQDFARTCERIEEYQDAARLRLLAQRLNDGVEGAWDGAWYLRAYYDDGTPLGTQTEAEGRIDSISQSWAVLSGAADPAHAAQAIGNVLERLVDKEARLVRLLWPPFEQGPKEPGYIKGYPPGIRENGAQYTHAATWLVWALADLGRAEESEQLFRMLNPIEHGSTAEAVARYRVEPYVLAGDVYSVDPHRGMGGWSWYTGSAAWYWRVGVEALLGIRIDWPHLTIDPKIPKTWLQFRASLRMPSGLYEICVHNPGGGYDAVTSTTLDGNELSEPWIDLEQSAGGKVSVVLGRWEASTARREPARVL